MKKIILSLSFRKTHTVCLFIDHTTYVFIKEKKDKKIAYLNSLSFPKSLIGKPHRMCAEGRTGFTAPMNKRLYPDI
jgi:hypothetical protein